MTLSNKPKNVKVQSDDFQAAESWFYEEPKGLQIVIRVDSGKYINVFVSWRALLASVGRYIGRKVTR